MSLAYRHPFTERWFVLKDGEWGNRAEWRSFPPHAGVDYNVEGGSSGKTIRAIAAGTIRGKGWSGTYGNRVWIEHDDGMWSHYAHMIAPSTKNNGDRVNVGDPIGAVGNTGSASKGAHLHLELAHSQWACNDGNQSIDPIAWIEAHKGSNPGTTPNQEDMVEAIVSAPNGLVVHLRPGGKLNFGSPQEYNTFRDQIAFLRNAGATDVMALPALDKVPALTWDTFIYLSRYIGAPE